MKKKIKVPNKLQQNPAVTLPDLTVSQLLRLIQPVLREVSWRQYVSSLFVASA